MERDFSNDITQIGGDRRNICLFLFLLRGSALFFSLVASKPALKSCTQEGLWINHSSLLLQVS